MKAVQIYTDGACSHNPGPGGWGVVLVYGDIERELSGGEPHTTNNRMELTAVIRGLGALREPCRVDLYTDSRYISDAINLGWLKEWLATDFKKGKIKNPDLWQVLLPLLQAHRVSVHWVRGHSGHAYNERCDRLATAAAALYKTDAPAG
ncbi:MAG: ribonuclease HI [Eubacteriales bacterium]